MDLVLEHLHALADVAPVELDLLLARAAGLAQAAALALEVRPSAHQARGEVLEPSELHLQLALAGLRALGEDLEDQLGAIEHAPAERLLEVSLLRRRKLVVEDDRGGLQRLGGAQDLPDLAAAGVELRIGPLPPALQDPESHDSGALHQADDFRDAFLMGVVAEVQAHDDRRLRVEGGGMAICGGAVQRNLRDAYSASFSVPRLIGREGTTVEMACL